MLTNLKRHDMNFYWDSWCMKNVYKKPTLLTPKKKGAPESPLLYNRLK